MEMGPLFEVSSEKTQKQGLRPMSHVLADGCINTTVLPLLTETIMSVLNFLFTYFRTVVPFMCNYIYQCKHCNPNGQESFQRKQASEYGGQ